MPTEPKFDELQAVTPRQPEFCDHWKTGIVIRRLWQEPGEPPLEAQTHTGRWVYVIQPREEYPHGDLWWPEEDLVASQDSLP